MSWYGSHATVTKEEAKAILPKAACKYCIYWVRFCLTVGEKWYNFNVNCKRCGLKYNINDRYARYIETQSEGVESYLSIMRRLHEPH